jgi:hypothetical protein
MSTDTSGGDPVNRVDPWGLQCRIVSDGWTGADGGLSGSPRFKRVGCNLSTAGSQPHYNERLYRQERGPRQIGIKPQQPDNRLAGVVVVGIRQDRERRRRERQCRDMCSEVLGNDPPWGTSQWDFHRCVNECMGREPGEANRLRQTPVLPVPQNEARTSANSGVWAAGGILAIVTAVGLVVAPHITIPALALGGAAALGAR